ncbi:MAG: gamma-glutamyltranspeptidase, partial [Actinobacteria bacterium]|nr:gamma-glutamyltranspeptidase [Actinomycetota bacterium]
ALAGPTSGFDTWDDMSQQQVLLEGHSPSTWRERLTARGHRIRVQPEWDSTFGHAHAIVRDEHGLAGAADPRARVSACLGR